MRGQVKRPQYLRVLVHPGNTSRDMPIGPVADVRVPEWTLAERIEEPSRGLRVVLTRSYLPPLATICVAPDSKALARVRAAFPAVAWQGHGAPLVLVVHGLFGEVRADVIERYAIAVALHHLMKKPVDNARKAR